MTIGRVLYKAART